MPNLKPTTVDVPAQRRGDIRVGHLLREEPKGTTRVAIIGFPSDAGVARNGGRPGASLGPEQIRRHLYRLTPPGNASAQEISRFKELLHCTVDLGDVRCSGDVAADQKVLGEVIAELLAPDSQVTPIVLGGGHETSYGHFLGYTDAEKRVRIVNLDAHADVRPLEDEQPHSGSPFRQAIEHSSGRCSGYAVAGLNPHSTAPDHTSWIRDHSGQTYFRSDVTVDLVTELYSKGPDSVLATFDLDALDQSQAPGVSAPNACGVDRRLWLAAARAAGRSQRVRSMDVVELSPPHDRDEQTARLAALTVWEFLAGLSERKQGAR